MDMPQYDVSTQPMKWHQKLAFGLGHIFNDLCAAMWFSLLLIYFQYIVHFPDNIAGYLLLLGQAVDAVSTPLIGYESDRIQGSRCLGKRKTWHLFGSVAVLISFPFIFTRCINCAGTPSWYQFAYYAPFVAIFQIGWASVQISHMALISHLTDNPSEKTELSGIRNAGTLLSSIVIFSAGWVFFNQDTSGVWDGTDALRFMILMFIVIGIGSVCTLVFHAMLKEKRDDDDAHESHFVTNEALLSRDSMVWYDWMKEPQFWLVAGLYMFSRLIVNVSGTYWPLYVLNTLHMAKMFVVIIPLVVNITGFIISLLMRLISDWIGRKMTMVVGIVLTLGGCCWLFFIRAKPLQVIGPAILVGGGGSVLIVSSLAMTTDIIGTHKLSGAFVFGAMSFADKLSNGLAVVFIQQYFPCPKSTQQCDQADRYYWLVMVYVIGGFTCALLVILLLIWTQNLGQLRKFADRRRNSSGDDIAAADGCINAAEDNDQNEHRSLINRDDSRGDHHVGSADDTVRSRNYQTIA